MSSKSEESEDGAGEDDVDLPNDDADSGDDNHRGATGTASRSVQDNGPTEQRNGLTSEHTDVDEDPLGNGSNQRSALPVVNFTAGHGDHAQESGSIDEILSVPDDTPSIQVSQDH